MAFVLDTSAVMALLGDEPGAERVEAILKAGDEALIPWPVLFEILYLAERAGGEETALQRYATVTQLPVRLLMSVDEPLILTAARLKARHPISQSDSLIAAYAQTLDAILIHKDPEYLALKEEIRQEPLPLKRGGR